MKRIPFLSILAAIGSVAIALTVSSCVDPTYYPADMEPVGVNNNGVKFKQDLEGAIANADRIVVLQHSHVSDFNGVIASNEKAPYYSYGSRVLSSGAKADFLSRVRNLSGYNSQPSNRQFEPHHTIKFYSAGRLKSTMQISFAINEVRWNGSKFIASQDIMRAIAPVVSNAGFSSNRDWNGLARIEYTSGRRTSGGSIGSMAGPSQTPTIPTSPTVKPQAQTPNPTTPTPAPVKPTTPTVPTAKAVPGKPGMVFNPFTNNHVDVNGIPSGTKVRDPNDSNQAHIFRVP